MNWFIIITSQFEIIIYIAIKFLCKKFHRPKYFTILIQNKIAYDIVPINSTLQVTAVKIYLNKKYTLCTICLPHIPFTYTDIENIIDQLPRPFLLLGDFNTKSPIWGGAEVVTDARGNIIEQILTNKNVSPNPFSCTNKHVFYD